MPLNQPAGDLIWSSLNSFKLLGWQHRLRKSMREKWRVALPRSHQSGQRRLGWSLSSLWSAVRYLAPAPGLENISPPGGQAALISGFASALKVAVAMGYLYATSSSLNHVLYLASRMPHCPHFSLSTLAVPSWCLLPTPPHLPEVYKAPGFNP